MIFLVLDLVMSIKESSFMIWGSVFNHFKSLVSNGPKASEICNVNNNKTKEAAAAAAAAAPHPSDISRPTSREQKEDELRQRAGPK